MEPPYSFPDRSYNTRAATPLTQSPNIKREDTYINLLRIQAKPLVMLSFVIVTSTLLFIQLLAVHAVPLTPSSPSSHLSIKRQALGSQLWFPTTTFKPIANRHAAPFQRGHSNNTNGTTTSPAPNSINYTISNPVLTGDTTIYSKSN